jgi:hypothetical protein
MVFMKKKLLKIVPLILCLALIVAVLAACTPTFRNPATPNSLTGNEEIEGNGGLAVRVGQYVFFINGVAGQHADNTFGQVQKGGIARVTLNQNGAPNFDTITMIVPQNVFHTSPTQGLIVHDGWIYYSTTSVDKNSQGEFKTNEMWLMRTRLDGTDTQILKMFSDFNVSYKVVNGFLIYTEGSEWAEGGTQLRQINLATGRDTLVDREVQGVRMTQFAHNQNAFIDAVFYTKANDNDKTDSTHNLIYMYRVGSVAPVMLMNGGIYDKENEPTGNFTTANRPNGYTLAIHEVVYLANGYVRLFYTRQTAGNVGTAPNALFSHDFGANLTFNLANETQYTVNDQFYTNITVFNDNAFFAMFNGDFVFVTRVNGSFVAPPNVTNRQVLVPSASSPQIHRIHLEQSESVTEVRVEFFMGNRLMSSRPLTIPANVRDASVHWGRGLETVFDAQISTSWLQPARIGNSLFFFSGRAREYAFFAPISSDEIARRPMLVSLMTDEDIRALAS